MMTTSHPVGRRGYGPVYRENQINHCPGCGRTHWYIGRTTAECGFCRTALPLEVSDRYGSGTFTERGKKATP